MLEKSFAVLFSLRKSKGYTTGELPIYMRVTANGERKEISVKLTCIPERWNAQARRAKGLNEAARTLNALLDSLERRVHEARLKLQDRNVPVTPDSILKIITGQGEKPHMLLEIFQQHNDKMAALENVEYAPATVTRYDTTLSHTRLFIEWKYGQPDIEIKQLGFDFASEFEFWLKSERKCNHNSVIKYIGNLRKIVTYYVKSGWLSKDPFFGFKMSKKEVVREYLSDDKLATTASRQFVVGRLSQVRDVSCSVVIQGLRLLTCFNSPLLGLIEALMATSGYLPPDKTQTLPLVFPCFHLHKQFG